FVLNDNFEPLPYATITHPKTGSWVIADEEGRFLLQTHVISGDSLIFSRYGYRNQFLVLTGAAQVHITLQREVIPMDGVEVQGQTLPSTTPWETVIVTETDRISTMGVYQRIPGALLKTYGGRGGISNVSLDGGQAEHTKIVLDGIDLTSPQNGQTDLSEIPQVFFQQMYQSRYVGTAFGSGAMDGVIQLRPWFNRSFLNAATGSFDFKSVATGYNLANNKTSLQFIGGGYSSAEDYQFIYDDTTYNRDNNNMDQMFFGGRMQYQPSLKTIVKSSVFLSKSDRGVAGSISFPSPHAKRINTLNLVSASLVRLLPSGYVRIHISRRANDEQYTDPYLSDDSRHKVSAQALKLNYNQRLLKQLEAFTALELRSEMIKSNDVGNHNRILSAITVSLTYTVLPDVVIRPNLRVDGGSSFRETTSDLYVQTKVPVLGLIRGRVGNGFRLPTLNDLFWPTGSYTDGNPNLKYEQSAYFSFGMDHNFSNGSKVSLEWRERHTNNLITWTAGDDFVWRPMNVDETLRKSYSISFRAPFITKNLSVSGYLTGNKMNDLASDKALPYVPTNTGQLQLQYSWETSTLDIQSYYSGERYYSGYDDDYNPIDITLAAFTNVSLGIHVTMPGWNSLRLHFTVENMLGADTSFFPEYPEPRLRVNGGISILL
ncbi:MAG: hypothetical protein ACJZ1S_00850, partial [Candidatus Neomarinimicrobiota bacterium]